MAIVAPGRRCCKQRMAAAEPVRVEAAVELAMRVTGTEPAASCAVGIRCMYPIEAVAH